MPPPLNVRIVVDERLLSESCKQELDGSEHGFQPFVLDLCELATYVVAEARSVLHGCGYPDCDLDLNASGSIVSCTGYPPDPGHRWYVQFLAAQQYWMNRDARITCRAGGMKWVNGTLQQSGVDTLIGDAARRFANDPCTDVLIVVAADVDLSGPLHDCHASFVRRSSGADRRPPKLLRACPPHGRDEKSLDAQLDKTFPRAITIPYDKAREWNVASSLQHTGELVSLAADRPYKSAIEGLHDGAVYDQMVEAVRQALRVSPTSGRALFAQAYLDAFFALGYADDLPEAWRNILGKWQKLLDTTAFEPDEFQSCQSLTTALRDLTTAYRKERWNEAYQALGSVYRCGLWASSAPETGAPNAPTLPSLLKAGFPRVVEYQIAGLCEVFRALTLHRQSHFQDALAHFDSSISFFERTGALWHESWARLRLAELRLDAARQEDLGRSLAGEHLDAARHQCRSVCALALRHALQHVHVTEIDQTWPDPELTAQANFVDGEQWLARGAEWRICAFTMFSGAVFFGYAFQVRPWWPTRYSRNYYTRLTSDVVLRLLALTDGGGKDLRAACEALSGPWPWDSTDRARRVDEAISLVRAARAGDAGDENRRRIAELLFPKRPSLRELKGKVNIPLRVSGAPPKPYEPLGAAMKRFCTQASTIIEAAATADDELRRPWLELM